MYRKANPTFFICNRFWCIEEVEGTNTLALCKLSLVVTGGRGFSRHVRHLLNQMLIFAVREFGNLCNGK